VKIERTQRGFRLATFVDYNGERCSIQESSIATQPMLWLGCKSGTHHHGECLARMHLTQAMAMDLLPMLEHFVETGELPDKAECPDSASCHGAMKWCDHCGDVRALCDDPNCGVHQPETEGKVKPETEIRNLKRELRFRMRSRSIRFLMPEILVEKPRRARRGWSSAERGPTGRQLPANF